ncbi:MAG: hypothetical protein ACPG6R_11240 [Aequoribacter sp.]|uniref:hypothetical protein n=1 Tax=Aequoribacter sp. TaxID=2847771 RepID=UPI003C451E1E
MKVAVWPLRSISNIRNELMYQTLTEISTVKLVDAKHNRLSVFRCDVLHLHWPERVLLNDKVVDIFLLAIYLFALRSFRVKILQTLHNDPIAFHREAKNLWLYMRLVVPQIQAFIRPSVIPSESSLIESRVISNIPLGLYPPGEVSEVVKYDYCIIGRLTRKKDICRQIEKLDLVCKASNTRGTLLICGLPESEAYAESIREICKGVIHITVDLEFGRLDESDFDRHLSSARSVVIFNASLTNSGVMTRAISNGIDVLTDNESVIADARVLYGCSDRKAPGGVLLSPPKHDAKNKLIVNCSRSDGIPMKLFEVYERILGK